MAKPPIAFTPGVLARDQLEKLLHDGYISTNDGSASEVGASAIDLSLGTRAHRLKVAERPTTRELSKIRAQSEEIRPVDGKFVFERGSIYLVEVAQHLNLPSNVSGRATGKSSVGRLDVITRLITEGSREYDVVPAGYEGGVHLLILPQTFTIRVAPGKSVNQLRLFSGAHADAVIRRGEAPHYGTPFWWVFKPDYQTYEAWDEEEEFDPTADPLLFDLTVDLRDPGFQHVLRARTDATDAIDLSSKGGHDPRKFFEPVDIVRDGLDSYVVLKRDSFYIMKSRERLHIPLDVAVEVVAISERIGDIRIHYAGFAHPGFGREQRPSEARRGTPLIFEVRATDMATKLYDRSVLARIQLFRMSKETTADKSDYEQQELKLSKVFSEWTSEEVK